MDTRSAIFRIFVRLHPRLWEIWGGGPAGPGGPGHRFTQQLGPSPQPWRAGPSPDPWREGPHPEPWRTHPEDHWAFTAQLAAVDLAHRLTDAASLIHAQGGDASGFLRALVDDDWCPLGRPIKLNLPAGWWILVPPPPPRPDERDQLAVVAAAGVSFTALSDGIRDKALSQAVLETGLKILDMVGETAAKLNLEAGEEL